MCGDIVAVTVATPITVTLGAAAAVSTINASFGRTAGHTPTVMARR